MKIKILYLMVVFLTISVFPYEENIYGEYFFYCQEYSMSLWFTDGEIYSIEPGLQCKTGDYEIIKSDMGYLLRIKLDTDEFYLNLHWGQKIKGVGIVKKKNVIRYNDGPEIKVEIKIEQIPVKCSLEKM